MLHSRARTHRAAQTVLCSPLCLLQQHPCCPLSEGASFLQLLSAESLSPLLGGADAAGTRGCPRAVLEGTLPLREPAPRRGESCSPWTRAVSGAWADLGGWTPISSSLMTNIRSAFKQADKTEEGKEGSQRSLVAARLFPSTHRVTLGMIRGSLQTPACLLSIAAGSSVTPPLPLLIGFSQPSPAPFFPVIGREWKGEAD